MSGDGTRRTTPPRQRSGAPNAALRRRLKARVRNRLIPAPRFVITGTGRCGTVFTARLLTNVGVPCGHEDVFTKKGVRHLRHLEGDSSYHAVAYLSSYRGIVVHQVRDPVKVVGSLVANGFFELPGSSSNLARVLPVLDRTGDPVRDAMQYVVRWNRLAQRHADLRIRIEDLADALPDLLGVVGHPELIRRARAELASMPTDVNARRANRITVASDLPDGPELAALRALATDYGYDWG
jgi:hypothetical protein